MSGKLCSLALLGLIACANEPSKSRSAEPTPAAVVERHFGAPFKQSGEPVEVAQVLQDPAEFLNKTVKCAGTVARVCENAGCWLELRATAAKQGAGLRVPLAGHNFFVPSDIVGRPAIVEGNLAQRELSQPELEHMQAEGLKAVGPLYLAATSVVVR
jgi:hypothetical protein